MKICPACGNSVDDAESFFCPRDGEVLKEMPTDLVGQMVGQVLDGQYEIESFIEHESLGDVYRGRHVLLGDPLVILILHPKLRNSSEWVRRFQREGRAARAFRHPNAVTVYDLRTASDGMIYMVMEFVEGHTLDKELKTRGRFTPAEALEMLEPIANVLDAAHGRGVLHLDLKPENILIGKADGGREIIKLLNLGIVRMVGAAYEDAGVVIFDRSSLNYFSPEQWGEMPRDGDPEVDGRTDIYSLGIIFYELISGRKPHSGWWTLAELRQKHVLEQVPPLHEIVPGVPEAFSRVVERAMSKDRSDRQATVGEFVNELRAALGLSPTVRPPKAAMSPPANVTGDITMGAPPPPMSVTCQQCDASVPGEQLFCQNCGAPVVRGKNTPPQREASWDMAATSIGQKVPMPSSPVSAPPGSYQSAPTSAPRGSGGIASLVALPFAALAAGAEKLYNLFRKGKPKSEDIPGTRIPHQPSTERAGESLRTMESLSARRGRHGEDTARGRDPVDCTVFAPPAVPQGEVFIVQVFAHRPEQAGAAQELAREFDRDAERRAVKSLEIEIERGSKLTFHLAMPGLEIDDPVQNLIWRGSPAAVQFGVTAPRKRPSGDVIGTVTVSQDGVPIGHIKFKLSVTLAGRSPAAREAEPLGEVAHRYQKAFISYASKDRSEVLKRVQMLSRLRIQFFQDVLDLEPGARWEKELYRHIDESDLFLLFWSSSAKQSPWVLEEVRYALGRKGGDDLAPPEIIPVIIEGPPPVEPPAELAHLHFNDYMLYFLAT